MSRVACKVPGGRRVAWHHDKLTVIIAPIWLTRTSLTYKWSQVKEWKIAEIACAESRTRKAEVNVESRPH